MEGESRTHVWQALVLGVLGPLLVLNFLISTSVIQDDSLENLIHSPLRQLSGKLLNEGHSLRSKEATEGPYGHPVKEPQRAYGREA